MSGDSPSPGCALVLHHQSVAAGHCRHRNCHHGNQGLDEVAGGARAEGRGAAAGGAVEDYRGRVIAVDASLSICQFLIVVGKKGSGLLTNEAGEVTSHLQGMLNRTVRMLEAGIKPVFVFDGEPPEMKKKGLAKRSLKRNDATKDLNRAMEIGDEDSTVKFSKRTVNKKKAQ
ncbi:hypothetical protein SETIT_3G367900v2 [Setaria italica]|uniref:XPG N-terminal domain-containing protein n=1 Tax=Setaria italica TaxID=4555 RepID=A0A368QMV0_SETIT|nr:hypothetical protein SETIT_3G367900v2 [Setaria italica]